VKLLKISSWFFNQGNLIYGNSFKQNILLKFNLSHSVDNDVSLALIKRWEHECLHETSFDSLFLLFTLWDDFWDVRFFLVEWAIDFSTNRTSHSFLLIFLFHGFKMLLNSIIVFFLFFFRINLRFLITIRRIERDWEIWVSDGYVSFLVLFRKTKKNLNLCLQKKRNL